MSDSLDLEGMYRRHTMTTHLRPQAPLAEIS